LGGQAPTATTDARLKTSSIYTEIDKRSHTNKLHLHDSTCVVYKLFTAVALGENIHESKDRPRRRLFSLNVTFGTAKYTTCATTPVKV